MKWLFFHGERDPNSPLHHPLVNMTNMTVIFTQVLISRNYRGDLEMSVIEKFFPLVLDCEDEGNASPIIVHESATFTYIKHHNLYGRY
jgi:hypothetical protein